MIENLDTQILQSESTNQKFSVLETEKQNVIGKYNAKSLHWSIE